MLSLIFSIIAGYLIFQFIVGITIVALVFICTPAFQKGWSEGKKK